VALVMAAAEQLGLGEPFDLGADGTGRNEASSVLRCAGPSEQLV